MNTDPIKGYEQVSQEYTTMLLHLAVGISDFVPEFTVVGSVINISEGLVNIMVPFGNDTFKLYSIPLTSIIAMQTSSDEVALAFGLRQESKDGE